MELHVHFNIALAAKLYRLMVAALVTQLAMAQCAFVSFAFSELEHSMHWAERFPHSLQLFSMGAHELFIHSRASRMQITGLHFSSLLEKICSEYFQKEDE